MHDLRIIEWSSEVDNGRDARNMAILVERHTARIKITTPTEGDFVVFPDRSIQRIAHVHHGGDAQTCHTNKGSFYLHHHGAASMSGTLNPIVPSSKLEDTGLLEPGRFWFFHHGQSGAHRAVYVSMPVRIWQLNP